MKKDFDKVTDYHDFTTINTSVKDRRKLDVGDIYINALICLKCGDYVRSRNRHDYRKCKCGAVAVDGGSWYAKWVGEAKYIFEVMVPFNKLEK